MPDRHQWQPFPETHCSYNHRWHLPGKRRSDNAEEKLPFPEMDGFPHILPHHDMPQDILASAADTTNCTTVLPLLPFPMSASRLFPAIVCDNIRSRTLTEAFPLPEPQKKTVTARKSLWPEEAIAAVFLFSARLPSPETVITPAGKRSLTLPQWRLFHTRHPDTTVPSNTVPYRSPLFFYFEILLPVSCRKSTLSRHKYISETSGKHFPVQLLSFAEAPAAARTDFRPNLPYHAHTASLPALPSEKFPLTNSLSYFQYEPAGKEPPRNSDNNL